MSTIEQQREEFKEKYITSSEVREKLYVSRTALHHRRRAGKLPEGISIDNSVTLWLRSEVRPYLEQWSVDMYGRVIEGL